MKKKNNQQASNIKAVNDLKKKLEEKEKLFNEDEKRFLTIIIKKEVSSLDLSSPWMIVERQLKKSNYTKTYIETIKKTNTYFTDLFLDISMLKRSIDKIVNAKTFRRQPVLREKGQWILKQAGEFRSIKSIFNDLTKKQGFNISLPTLKSFILEHRSEIDKNKDDFKNEIMNSNISVDTGRLKFWDESFEYYYNKWKMDGRMADFNACAKIINEVRAEIKGDLVVKIDGRIDINHSIEANKSLNQRLGELSINSLIISKAAQKININPLLLQTQLTNSYYNRWNGIEEKPLQLKDKDTLILPNSYIKQYQWDKIAKKNENGFEYETIDDALVIDENEINQLEKNKKLLLTLLNKY